MSRYSISVSCEPAWNLIPIWSRALQTGVSARNSDSLAFASVLASMFITSGHPRASHWSRKLYHQSSDKILYIATQWRFAAVAPSSRSHATCRIMTCAPNHSCCSCPQSPMPLEWRLVARPGASSWDWHNLQRNKQNPQRSFQRKNWGFPVRYLKALTYDSKSPGSVWTCLDPL